MTSRQPLSRLVASLALVFAALAYLVPFGVATWVSVAGLLSETTATGDPDYLGVLIGQMSLVGFGLVLAWGAVKTLGDPWRLEWAVGRSPAVRGTGLLTAGLALLALMGGYGALAPFLSSGSADTDEAPLWFALPRAFAYAGLGEELIVLALPIVALRALTPSLLSGRWLALTVPVLVSLRMPYHLYHGEWILTLLPWALVTVLIYIRWGRVWPLILQHTFYNTMLALSDVGYFSQRTLIVTLVAAGLGCTAAGLWRMRVRPREVCGHPTGGKDAGRCPVGSGRPG